MESFEDIAMKYTLNPKFLPPAALAAGIVGCGLRRLLYAVAVDAKNLLPVMHPIEIALWVLTAAAAALIILQVRKLGGSEAYSDNFAPSVPAAAGALALAAGILVTVLTATGDFPGPVGKLWKMAGLLSAPALVLVALFRLKGRKPLFLCHFAVCLFCVLHLVSRYQSWSSNPQLQDYFFCLGGSVLMTLFAFYQTAFDVDSGQRQMQLGVGLLGTVFCLTALAYSQTPALYLAGGLWMLTGLCAPVPVPAAEEAPENQEEDHGDS